MNFCLAQIAVLIEDKQFVESFMNGKPWKAGKFSHSLRLSLWLEHLGLRADEVSRFFLLFLKLYPLPCVLWMILYLQISTT